MSLKTSVVHLTKECLIPTAKVNIMVKERKPNYRNIANVNILVQKNGFLITSKVGNAKWKGDDLSPLTG